MNFEEYWGNYGELHASLANGNIKQFAKGIWLSAHGDYEKLKIKFDNLRFDMEPKWKAHSNLEKCGKCGRKFYHKEKEV